MLLDAKTMAMEFEDFVNQLGIVREFEDFIKSKGYTLDEFGIIEDEDIDVEP